MPSSNCAQVPATSIRGRVAAKSRNQTKKHPPAINGARRALPRATQTKAKKAPVAPDAISPSAKTGYQTRVVVAFRRSAWESIQAGDANAG
ncbi:MAG TPA: hypothetical protein VN874_03980 [Myxococcales bacterium]|nr:hypothetical protein [Myxococcales bacterium]